MAIRAKAFGMKIQYHNRSRLPAELEAGATYVSFDELLANADVLSLNLALNASTRHIIGANEFSKMKDGVVIVNTARGALIDEKALVAALESDKVCDTAFGISLGYRTRIDMRPFYRSDLRVWMYMNVSQRLNQGLLAILMSCCCRILVLRLMRLRRTWRFWSWITCGRPLRRVS